jgi:hypothetical protein
VFRRVHPEKPLLPHRRGELRGVRQRSVSVVVFKEAPNYSRNLMPLLQSCSATLQQAKGEWQARVVTVFTEAVEMLVPCAITLRNSLEGPPPARCTFMPA